MGLYCAENWVKDLRSEYGVSKVTIHKRARVFTPISLEEGYDHIHEKVTKADLNHFIKKYKAQYSVQKM
ncbi:hypothetical protein ACQKJC_22375 [Priestia koreensis]|uniref:hypothetical protein n=1 Tax=Priestia koreensis TaxID=284581 RepID=UPI003D020F13